MADGPPKIPLKCFVRVVELPLDPYGVHLVVEVSRPGTPASTPDYRSPTTVCGQVGYGETTRSKPACDECARGYPEASISARMAARATLSIRHSAVAANGHARRI